MVSPLRDGTPRERFVACLERRPIVGRVPHFELVFYLTMEAFGKVHPTHRNYHQWDQMEERERQLHRNDIADLYIATAERYEHSAIFVHPAPGSDEEAIRTCDLIREKSGEKYFLMLHGDSTYSIPDGNSMEAFSYRMIDEPQTLKDEAQRGVEWHLERARKFKAHGLDGFALCADYCLNAGPFMSPTQFGEFVTPYLKQLVAGYREQGYYAIKHTDGNIMPILDQIAESQPHALHSLDPQGGMDMAVVKRLYGDRLCLIGNVNCGLMDTGTDEQVLASARYALAHGMPGGGYIFSTSNCVYTGMALKRYEMILDVWRREGNYA